jgi:hypothetical protein
MPFWIAALLPKMATAKAQAAGHGDSMSKACNAGRRHFGRNPKGRPLRGRIAAS